MCGPASPELEPLSPGADPCVTLTSAATASHIRGGYSFDSECPMKFALEFLRIKLREQLENLRQIECSRQV